MANTAKPRSHGIKEYSSGLRLNLTVIYALILRETRTSFGNTKIGYLWALFEPIAYIGIFILIFSLLGRSSPLPGDLAYFFLTGLFPFLMFRKISQKIMKAESGNKALITYPQVTTLDTKLARVALEVSVSFIALLLMFIALQLLGFTHFQLNSIYQMILCLFTLTLFSLGFGLICAFIMNYWPTFEKLYNMTIGRTLFYVSGIFFLPEQIPLPYRDWLAYNPVTRFISWFRDASYASYESAFGYTYELLFLTLLLLFTGLSLERIGQYKKLSS